jgi:NAD(P)-dependent dehydrogenase (short-subunit alcohol dehydrogenase family)
VHIDLGGEIALVTASTAGIGLATAKGLAAAGAMVIVNGRTQGRVERAMKAVGAGAPGAKVVGIVADAGNANGCDAFVILIAISSLTTSESTQSRTFLRFPTVNGFAFWK